VDRVIRLDVEYDGTGFHGFSPQRNQRTVGGELERAVTRLTGVKPGLTPAGRTDSGVHASGQVVSFRTESQASCETIKRALNAMMPRDLLVARVTDASPDFDARRSASSRRYSYLVWNGVERSVRDWRWSVHVTGALDVDAMNEACRVLLGRHDFAAFRTHAAQDDPAGSTRRKMDECQWTYGEPAPGYVRLDIQANAFLRHMVRVVAGTALLIGQHKLPIAAMGEILASRDRGVAGPTAPAHGLTLVAVSY
jgi:tRNA pseudouridine38-40 synthase